MWSLLQNVSCALQKQLYSSAFRWSVLKISMRSISSDVSFKTCVSLSIFYFDDLSIGVSGVLKSPIVIVLLSISPFTSISVCLRRKQWHPTTVLMPMDGGAWKASAHGVAEGRTRLNDFTFTFHFHALEKEMATHSSVLA